MPDTTEPTDTTEPSGVPTPVLSLLNQKGGVGKTTLVVHLAGALAERGHDVLVVDLAPEGDTTSILGFGDEYDIAAGADRPTIHDALLDPARRDELAETIVDAGEFHLLPANERMVDATSSALEDVDRGRERLAELLDESIVGEYDVVLVDNEPAINTLTDNALVASDGVIIPMYAEALSVQGLDRLEKQIAGVRQHFTDVELVAIVLNRVEANNQSAAIVERVREGFGELAPVVEIRKRVALQRSLARDNASIFASGESSDMTAPLLELAEHVEATLDVDEAAVEAGGRDD